MAHITLSIPDETYRIMKRHPEINWSEIARQNILEKAPLIEKSMSGKELLSLLPEDIRKSILSADKKQSIEFTKKVRQKEWERVRFLTRLQSSKASGGQ